MNPFELPPTTSPVSTEPPDPPAPRRGRMALVALASAGLLAGGVVGVSALVSADDPELEPAAEPIDAAPTSPDEENTDSEAGDGAGEPSIDGEIVIDTGDGDPIVVDVGALADIDADQLAQLAECAGLPMWFDVGPMADLPFDEGEFGDFGMFEGDLDEMFDAFEEMFGELPADGFLADGAFGGEITVMGPDGVTVIDLGDGDGSVTVSRDAETGELTITTDGTATEQQLDELFGEFGFPDLPEDLQLDELDLGEFLPEGLDELLQDFPGEFGAFDVDIDPQQIADCLAELD